MTSPAPSDAPEETPSVNEDARGFFKTDCMTAPLTEREAPARKARKTRGSLSDQIMPVSLGLTPSGSRIPAILCRMTAMQSGGGMKTDPAPVPRIRTSRDANSERPKAVLFEILRVHRLRDFAERLHDVRARLRA